MMLRRPIIQLNDKQPNLERLDGGTRYIFLAIFVLYSTFTALV